MNRNLEFKRIKNRSYLYDYRGTNKFSVRKLDHEQILGIVDEVICNMDKDKLLKLLEYIIISNHNEGSFSQDRDCFVLDY